MSTLQTLVAPRREANRNAVPAKTNCIIPSGPNLLPYYQSVVYYAKNRTKPASNWIRMEDLFSDYLRYWIGIQSASGDTLIYATKQKTFASMLKKYAIVTGQNWSFSYRPESVVYGIDLLNNWEV